MVMLEFAKMHGLGNDFMVIDLVTQTGAVRSEQVRAWADRHTGVGFDQLLLIEPPTQPDADFRYRIFNADGSEVAQCGNGARCAAWYVAHRRLSPKPDLVLQTNTGLITTRLLGDDQVEVGMGVPSIEPAEIPFDPRRGGAVASERHSVEYVLEVGGRRWPFVPVSIGNPHAVLFIEHVSEAPVAELGAALVAHPAFPEGANIGFCQVVDRGFLRLRVFERGVGETQACGSGACAAVVAAQLLDHVGSRVKVSLPGGKVRIAWNGPGSDVRMTGPAALVYEGRIRW
jgi:diaminopimelate epimerase